MVGGPMAEAVLCPKCAGLGRLQYDPQRPFGSIPSTVPGLLPPLDEGWPCDACSNGVIIVRQESPPLLQPPCWAPPDGGATDNKA